MTFDIILTYYDNPLLLNSWLYRLFHGSDYLKFAHKGNIIISDTGTPLNRIDETLKILTKYKSIKEVIYFRAETDEIRAKVPEGIDSRPASHSYNLGVFEVSKAELILVSVVGQVYTPKYFEKVLIEHIKDDKAVVLPKRMDLICEDYHELWFDKSFSELMQFPIQGGGGWPDVSVKRKWLIEVGGWDENYITIAPIDMDLGSRLTGKLDNGMDSQILFPNKGYYENLGLHFKQPFDINEVMSLTCNTYKKHIPVGDPRRQRGLDLGEKYYLENWSKIKRNENRIPIKFSFYTY